MAKSAAESLEQIGKGCQGCGCSLTILGCLGVFVAAVALGFLMLLLAAAG